MRTVLLAAAAHGLLAVAAHCQLEASTLERLTRTAPIVARVTVDAILTGAELIQARMLPRQVWRGDLPSSFVLAEGQQVHCGAALAHLHRGQELVVFADRIGDRLLPIGGARGLVTLEARELPAIEALLATNEAAARLSLVVALLDHPSLRVRADASLALPTMPGLEAAPGAVRSRLAQQLDRTLAERDPTLAATLLAVARTEPERAAGLAWRAWANDTAEIAELGRHLLQRVVEPAASAATAPVPDEPAAAQRVAELLTSLRRIECRPALRRLALHAALAVRTEAARGLLFLGDDAPAIAALTGADAVQVALRRPLGPPARRAVLRR